MGMIASRRKREIIYRSLLEEGFTEPDLERVCSPIRLDIGARTPAEIAVRGFCPRSRTRSHRTRSGKAFLALDDERALR